MRRAAACTACIAAGAACLLAGEYFFHIALDASTDKSALLKPAPGAKKPENGPTYSGQAIKTAPSKRAEQPNNNASRSYDAGDMEIKIPEFLQKRR